jgi:hypothetical protein
VVLEDDLKMAQARAEQVIPLDLGHSRPHLLEGVTLVPV